MYNSDDPSVKVMEEKISLYQIYIRHATKDYVLVSGKKFFPENGHITLYDKWRHLYRAFCAGSIIADSTILTSANCFLTNKKKFRHKFANIRAVAGILKTIGKEPTSRSDSIEQWRLIEKVLSQRFYRYPAFSLAVVKVNKPWVYNTFVNKIPYSSRYHDFDGVCTGTAVKATKSWSKVRYVYTEEVQMIKREECERILCRNCRLFMCTMFDNRNKYAFSETEGGGLICYETEDPRETGDMGVLVAITSIVNIGLPNLSMRVGLFHKWVTDASIRVSVNKFMMTTCLTICVIKTFLV